MPFGLFRLQGKTCQIYQLRTPSFSYKSVRWTDDRNWTSLVIILRKWGTLYLHTPNFSITNIKTHHLTRCSQYVSVHFIPEIDTILKNLKSNKNSTHQKCDIKQVPYSGSTNVGTNIQNLAVIAPCRQEFVRPCFIRLICSKYFFHVSNSDNTAPKDWMILVNNFEMIS